MRKGIALLLALVMLLTTVPAWGEEVTEEVLPAELPNELVVGNTTVMSGNFFNHIFGNNTADIDVQSLIHGYYLVNWSNDFCRYDFDPQVVGGSVTRMDPETGDESFIIALNKDLTYSDGTPITAGDYAFGILLSAAPEIRDLGGNVDDSDFIPGIAAYKDGTSAAIPGVRVLGDYVLEIRISGEYLPYFYHHGLLDYCPMPIHVIAPGCEVADEGEGVFIRDIGAEDKTEPSQLFTTELLEKTLLDPETGYVSHPSVSSGPYVLTDYQPDTHTATFAINEYYKGDPQGNKPGVAKLTYRPADNDTALQELRDGTLGLFNKATRADTIREIIAESATGGAALNMASYPRTGYSSIACCWERPAMKNKAVRQAIANCFDAESFVEQYVGEFGMRVTGYYGVGQWMYGIVTGTVAPPIGDLPEDETEEETEEKPEEEPEQAPGEEPGQAPDEKPEQAPDEKPEQAPDEEPEQVPDEEPEWVPDEEPEWVPDEEPEWVPDEEPEWVPSEEPEWVPSEEPEWVPGEDHEWVPGDDTEWERNEDGEWVPHIVTGRGLETVAVSGTEEVVGRGTEEIVARGAEEVIARGAEEVIARGAEEAAGGEVEAVVGRGTGNVAGRGNSGTSTSSDKREKALAAELAKWEQLSLDNVKQYNLDTAEAVRLLEADGWILNSEGEPFDPAKDEYRCRRESDGSLTALDLKLIYPEGNIFGEAVQEMLADHLKEAGIRLTAEAMPFTELLKVYYRQTERDVDMIYLATNFTEVFEPSATFDPADALTARNNRTACDDEQLYSLAVAMRKTPTGDVYQYMQKWIAFQERYAEVLPTIPVYSNVYFDFFTDRLNNYNVSDRIDWTEAIVPAYLQ